MKQKFCFQCGKVVTNEHHVIPQALNPLKNIKIPLCDEHKDICHLIIKQLYFPKELRQKIGKIKKQSDNLNRSISSLKNNLDFTKQKIRNTDFHFSSENSLIG